MKHNMTNEEREDLNHWYNEAQEGIDKLKIFFPKTDVQITLNIAYEIFGFYITLG